MQKYSVFFTINGSVEMNALNEGEAIKKFWEKENRYLINNISRNANVNMEDLKIEPKGVILREHQEKRMRIFGRR